MLQLPWLLQFALPYGHHLPAKCFKHGLVAGVARSVACDLALPELAVGFDLSGPVHTARAAVPKAPVHQKAKPPRGEYQVGSAGKALPVETEP